MSPPPTKGEVGGQDTLFLGGSNWCRHQRRRKTSCPHCNLNTPWNISMILGRNVDKDEMTCRIQD